jgi:hypothetical protein
MVLTQGPEPVLGLLRSMNADPALVALRPVDIDTDTDLDVNMSLDMNINVDIIINCCVSFFSWWQLLTGSKLKRRRFFFVPVQF